jgi:polyphosphate kinase 2
VAKKNPEKVSYKEQLRELQIALVKAHRHVIAHGRRVLLVFEGRDGAGKDGAIKRIVEHLSPRETRVVALGKPSDRELGQWYFQRYTAYLPTEGEFVLFNRSWYNRAGVEPVMHFCTRAQAEDFLHAVVPFERMLTHAGIELVKYYLDISKDEQKRRLAERARDPLTQWKTSDVDDAALGHWDDYSQARDAMLEQTHSPAAPWVIVRCDDKKRARINIMRDLVRRIERPDEEKKGKHRSARHLAAPDSSIVFTFRPGGARRLAH